MAQSPKTGFTLIELLIVIAIIGLLATLAIVSLTTAQRKARDTKRLDDTKQLQNSVELYYRENNAYPLATNATNATWGSFAVSLASYITNMPIDPTNDDATNYVYTYASNDAGDEYVVGAKLEDVDHDALNGDDDTLYDALNAGWNNFDAVESDDAADETITSFDCGTTIVDATAGIYCLSD